MFSNVVCCKGVNTRLHMGKVWYCRKIPPLPSKKRKQTVAWKDFCVVNVCEKAWIHEGMNTGCCETCFNIGIQIQSINLQTITGEITRFEHVFVLSQCFVTGEITRFEHVFFLLQCFVTGEITPFEHVFVFFQCFVTSEITRFEHVFFLLHFFCYR